MSVSEDERIHHQLQDFWRTESFGCAFEGKTALSADDKHAVRNLETTTRNLGNRYEIGLLWRYEQPSLSFNRVLAEGRFAHLERKFASDPELGKRYSAIIAKYIDKKYARQLSLEEPVTERRRLGICLTIQYFLPTRN